MLPREPVTVVLKGQIPAAGLAIEPVTRWVFKDGQRIGSVVGFASLKPGSPEGWLQIDIDEG